jgi:hypothetical protein
MVITLHLFVLFGCKGTDISQNDKAASTFFRENHKLMLSL